MSWSPDGSRAALVPNFLSDGGTDSGIWVYDTRTGRTRQILETGRDIICANPQWSSSGDEILFAMVESEQGGSRGKEEGVRYAIWITGPEGEALRIVMESTTTDGEAFLSPNAIAWGPIPGTVVFQRAVDDKVTAMLLDLRTGTVVPYLPDVSDLYALAPSPDRRRVAALLQDKESHRARIYTADFARADWRLLETLQVDPELFETCAAIIYWSPDSSRFVVPEEETHGTAGSKGKFLRLFEAGSGVSHRICSADPESAILWNRESSAFVFTASAKSSDESSVGLFRVDTASGISKGIVLKGENHLLAWNREDGRIYFYRTYDRKENETGRKEQEHRLFSCDSEGARGITHGYFYSEGNICSSISPTGNRLMVFDDSHSAGYAYLTSGESLTNPLRE